MHYRAEIIMPPTDDVEQAVNQIMAPFYEGADGSDDYVSEHRFWDWWQIGGRYSGAKLTDSYDKSKIEAFYEWLRSEEITVSGLIMGKQEISPSSQIEKVDKKWNEIFPLESGQIVPCPLFAHAGLRLDGDILPLSKSLNATAHRVIFAAPGLDLHTKTYIAPLRVTFMLQREAWNGVNFENTAWDGTVQTALEEFKNQNQLLNDEYKENCFPKNDWLVITVDYHS